MELVQQSLALASLAVLVLIPVAFYQTPLTRWFARKRYQYEVTFSLYMMTPTEKFILNSFLFLTFSMILIAASLYLPEHILKVSHRAFYYYSGQHGHPGPEPPAANASAAAATYAAAASHIARGAQRAFTAAVADVSSAVAGAGASAAAGARTAA